MVPYRWISDGLMLQSSSICGYPSEKHLNNAFKCMFSGRISTKNFRQNDHIFHLPDLPQSAESLIIKGKKAQWSRVIMPFDKDEMIQILIQTNKEQERTIEDLRNTIRELRITVANLNETLDEFKRKFFGTSREKMKTTEETDSKGSDADEIPAGALVKEHTRTRKKKSVRADLYEALPVRDIKCPLPEKERFCPDCSSPMEHLGYKFVREELRITPAKVERVRYLQESLVCPACREEDETTIISSKTPTPLLAHSPASADMVAMVMYQKSYLHLPFYRQSKDWMQKGVPFPRETASHWYNYCALEYLMPVYELLHQELIRREIIHADEVPCQVLHEEGKTPTSKSYFWIYLSGTDGKPPITLYHYAPGRSGNYPIEFLSGFNGMLHCDGYSAYGRIEDVILVCCLAHCRRKFYEALPKERQKKIRLLDINSELEVAEPVIPEELEEKILPAEKGVMFCNRLFFQERLLKELPAEERKQKRLETETEIWDEFWLWLDTLVPSSGSKLEKAINYAINHKETLMNYLLDGRCEISNNAAERMAKTYVTGRKNFLFHDTADGATASSIVLSLIETAKANNLNIYQYLYLLLLYMPDYKNEPAGIEQLLPWSDFIKERCSGVIDTENITAETRGNLPV